MADFSDKADELAGRAKEAAGKATGNDDLRAEGAVDKAGAKVSQGIDAASDKAAEVKDTVADAASTAADVVAEKAGDAKYAADTVQQRASDVVDEARGLDLDDAGAAAKDPRVLIAAAIAGIAVVVLATRARAGGTRRRGQSKRAIVGRVVEAVTPND